MVVGASKDLSIFMLSKFINLSRLDLEDFPYSEIFLKVSSYIFLILWL